MSKGYFGFLIGRSAKKPTADSAQPKNETLLEHRKHCKAKEGNCPFEKALARETESEDTVKRQEAPKTVENDSWKNYTIWKCQYNLINTFKKEADNLTQDQSRMVADLGNGSIYAGRFCDYLRVHNRNLSDEQRKSFESLDLARRISEEAEGANKKKGYGFNKSDIADFVSACKEIDGGKLPSKEGIVPSICLTPESARAYIFARLEDANFDEEFNLLKDGKYDEILKANESGKEDEAVDQHDFDKLKDVIAGKLDGEKPLTAKEFTNALQAYIKDNPMPQGAAESKHEFTEDAENGEVQYQNRFIARDSEDKGEVSDYFEDFLSEIGCDEPWKCISLRDVSDGRDGIDVEVFVNVKCKLQQKS